MRLLLLACFIYIPSLVAIAQATESSASISVAISDNIIIIDGGSRSGTIDLVNGGADPVLFTVYPINEPIGIIANAEPYLRWAPETSLAPAHRSVSFRVLARSSSDLDAGEYAFQFGVRAEVQRQESPITLLEDDDKANPLVTASVPIVPVLPITVYLRHAIETPRVDPQPLVLTPEDDKVLGYFMLTKVTPQQSFIGQVQVIDRTNDSVLSSGRLHLAQAGTRARVEIPRGEFDPNRESNYCLLLWDHFPGEGEPYITMCND